MLVAAIPDDNPFLKQLRVHQPSPKTIPILYLGAYLVGTCRGRTRENAAHGAE